MDVEPVRVTAALGKTDWRLEPFAFSESEASRHSGGNNWPISHAAMAELCYSSRNSGRCFLNTQ